MLDSLLVGVGLMHEGVVADAPEEAVRDSWCTSAACRDLGERGVVDAQIEEASRARKDPLEFAVLVELEVCCEAEAVPQGSAGGRRGSSLR